MKFHPLANLFPLISKDERSRLAADIKQRGLNQPVVTHEGKTGRPQPMVGVPGGRR